MDWEFRSWKMATLLKASLALVLAIGLAGCANTGASSMPCASCKFGVPDKKTDPVKHSCMIEGKQVDCRKSPAECPECAKAK